MRRPGFYLLFVLNEAGVPSIAKIVRMGVASDPNPAIKPILTNPGAPGQHRRRRPSTCALSASDPNGDVLTYAASGLPSGLSINPTTGRISGTPTDRGHLQRRRDGERRRQHATAELRLDGAGRERR